MIDKHCLWFAFDKTRLPELFNRDYNNLMTENTGRFNSVNKQIL